MEKMTCGSVDYERVRASWRYERTGAVWRMQARRAWESEINSPLYDPMAGAQATVLIADNRTEYEQSSYGLRHWCHRRAQEALLSLGAEIAARWARVFLGSRCAFAFEIEEDVEGIVFGGEEVLDATLDGSVPRIMLCDDADSTRVLERYRRAAALASCLEMGKVEHLFLERFDTTTRSWAIEEEAMLTSWEVLNSFEGWMEDCDKAREQVQSWLADERPDRSSSLTLHTRKAATWKMPSPRYRTWHRGSTLPPRRIPSSSAITNLRNGAVTCRHF